MSVIRYQVEWPGSKPLILGKSLGYPALVPDGDGESFLCVEKPRRVIVPKLLRPDSDMADAMADAWNEISEPGDDAILLSVRFHYRDTLKTDIDGEDPIVDYGYLCFVPSDEGWTTLREAGATAIPAVSLLDLKYNLFPMIEHQSLKDIQEIEDHRMLEALQDVGLGLKVVEDARREGTEANLLTSLWKDSPEVPAFFQGKKNVGAQLVSLEPDEAAEVLRDQNPTTLGQVSERDLSRTVPLPWSGTHRFETYKVMQRIHLGAPVVDLWEGTRVEFNGEILRTSDGEAHRAPNLKQAIGLGWLVRDSTLLIPTGQRCGMTDFSRIQAVYEMARTPLEEVPERFKFELVSNYEISAYDLLNQTHAKYTFEHAGDGMATVRHTASGLTKLLPTAALLEVSQSQMSEFFYDG